MLIASLFYSPSVAFLKVKKHIISERDDSMKSPMPEMVRSSPNFLTSSLKQEYQSICLMPFQYRGFFGLKNMFNLEAVRNDLAEMKEFGVNAITVDVYMSQAKPSENGDGMSIDLDEYNRYLGAIEQFVDLCNEMNISIFMNIITGTNFQFLPDWVYDQYPDVAALDQNNETVKSFLGNKPWHSTEHAAVNMIKREIIETVVNRFKNKKNVIAWGLDGETFYGTLFYPEHWLDYSDYAICHYREWLKRKYKTIEALNEAWNKSYLSFEEIDPIRSPGRNAESLDWHLYRINAITEYVAWQYRLVKSLDPERLVFGFMADVPYRNQELVRAGSSPVEYLSITDGYCGTIIDRETDFPFYNTLYRMIIGSFGKPIQASESFCYPPPPTYEKMLRFLYEHLGLGAWYMGIGTWDAPLDLEWQNKGTEAEDAIRTVYSEVSRMPLEYMWPIKPKIAVFLSELTWIMDGFKDSWRSLHSSLIRSHYPFRYIFSRQILGEEAKEIPLIISVDNEIVESEVVEKLKAYVQEGGNLVVVGSFYEEDEHLKTVKTPTFLASDEKWISFDGSISYRIISYGEGKILQIRKGKKFENKITKIMFDFSQQIGITKPVAIKATLQNGEEASESIEAFTLSDGVNLAVIIINLMNSKIQLKIKVDAKDYLDDANYIIKELRSGDLIEYSRSEQFLNLNMSINPNDVAVLYIERETGKEEVMTLLNVIENQLDSLASSNAEVSLAKYFKDQAQLFLETNRCSKALACAYKVLNQLFIKVEAQDFNVIVGNQLTARVKVLNFKGMPVENATVIATYMDTEIPLKHEGKGTYKLTINTDALNFYNYFGRKYSPITGQIQFNIRAEKDGNYGRTVLPINIQWREGDVNSLHIEADPQITASRWSTAIILVKIKDENGIPVKGANVSIGLLGKMYRCRNLGDEFYFTAIPITINEGKYTLYIAASYKGLIAESKLTLVVSDIYSSIFNIAIFILLILLGIALACILRYKDIIFRSIYNLII